MAKRAAVAAAVAWGSIVFAFLQWSTPHLVDRDSLYHARYAQLLPERGLARDFPWTQESVWRDRFSDKEFLFHILLVPFCRGDDPAPGAKIAGHLARRGAKLEVRNIDSRGKAVSGALMDEARATAADLIVMGGYSSSRLREMVFGGATRDLLRIAEIPLLMAH